MVDLGMNDARSETSNQHLLDKAAIAIVNIDLIWGLHKVPILGLDIHCQVSRAPMGICVFDPMGH